jgi:hypothetical protein
MTTEWWVPVLSFAGGSGVTLAVEYLRTLTARADRQQAAIERRQDREAERVAKERERRSQLEDEHRASQREALVELQEKLSNYIRVSGQSHHADYMAWKAAGKPNKYPVSLLPHELSESLNTLQRRIQILSERIGDEHVRSGVANLTVTVNDSLSISDPDEAWTSGAQASLLFKEINASIGNALRSLTSSGGQQELPE